MRTSRQGTSSPSSDQTTPLLNHDREPNGEILPEPSSTQSPPKVVSWSSLPKKGQLAVIVFARLAEPLSERSLTSYLFYQLRWLDPTLSTAEIARQAGYLTAMFAVAQCITSMWWGHAADNPRLGRKRVLVIGLMGSAISAVGMGFSTSIYGVFFFRFLAGALNGNVGVLRTMISEVVDDRRYQSRAFLLLPMCFNVGVIIGPLLSGFLADPIHSLPSLFGPGSVFGGRDGVAWMKAFPYALPNVLFSAILTTAALGIIMGLDETHPQLRDRVDRGRQLGKLLVSRVLRRSVGHGYQPISNSDGHEQPLESVAEDGMPPPKPKARKIERAPLRAVLTRKVCLTMAQRFLQALHVSAFNSMFFTLLPAPPQSDRHDWSLPFRFSGGLGLSSKDIGFANTTIGMIGLPLQLILYPRLVTKIGVRNSYKYFLPLSILAYFWLPYLVLLPGDDAAVVWTCLSIVLTMHVMSRTFVNPATVMMVNDLAPRPELLGTVHGVASSVSSAARVIGPTVGGLLLGWGLSHNFVGLPLWLLSLLAIVNWVIILWIDDDKASR